MSGAPEMIVVRDLQKTYGEVRALRDVSVTIPRGQVVAIVGPSGSGKSTFIRTINFLEPFERGSIVVDGIPVGPEAALDAIRREVGMVFQNFNLFPHMTALENITLAPRQVRGLPAQEAERQARELLARVGMPDKADRLPAELSGGQQQRVAIARALAMQPKVMLFDEPTSALDPEMVGEVLAVMRELAHSGMTMLIVTHQMRFAREVAHRVLFFDEGRILEDASPAQFFDAPSHARSREFLARLRQSE